MSLPSPSETLPPAGARPDPLVGRTVTHYRVEEQLGGGGMGVVYRARDLTLERDVALKFLPARLHADAEARTRLLQEARAASALDHPNIASVYEIGEAADGRLFIAMACYRGETLKKRVTRGPVPPDEAMGIALQMAEGLAHAHRADIVHRDVKPANVMLTDEGRAVVVDFGIAQTDRGGASTGDSSGTAPYMSPEQVTGAPTDAHTDVWGLGATLYEMLSGRRPFGGAYAAATNYAITHEPPAPLGPGVPTPLAEVVDRCLAKDPADRYPDAGAVADALRTLRGERTAPGLLPTTRRGRAVLWARRLPRAAQVGLALAAVVGLVAALALGRMAWPTAGVQHVAVLPFRTLGGGAEAEALSAGLVETLTSQISQIVPRDGSMWVIPASEVTAGLTPSQAREQLGATLVVDGTIQLEDGRARVTINLIDTETLRQIATAPIEHLASGALALQDQAAFQLARLLRVNVGIDDQERLAAGGTDDPEANDLYLRGRGVLRNAQTEGDVQEAVGLFRQALDRDDAFALAHAALGEALWNLYGRTDDVAFAQEAIRASERALDLDAGLAPVHVSLGIIYAGQQDFARALDAFDRALVLDPLNVEAARRRAGVLNDQGRTDEAEAAYLHAISLRPDYWRTYSSFGVFYYSAGRLDEAIATYQRGLDLAPSNLSLLNNLAVAFWEAGRLNEAVVVFERLRRVDPEHGSATVNLATARFYLGDFPEAAALYAEELARHPDQYQTRQNLGDALWWSSGRREEARTAYRQSIRGAWDHLSVARSPDVIGSLAGAYAKLGVRDSALAYLDEFRSAQGPDDDDPDTAFGVGTTYEILGEHDKARRWIQSALDRGYGRVEYDHSPWLARLRTSSPRP